MVELKLSCARTVERVKLEKINKIEPVTRNAFDQGEQAFYSPLDEVLAAPWNHFSLAGTNKEEDY